MYITNEMNYGHLIDSDNYNISLTQPELYEIFNNVKVIFLTKNFHVRKIFFKDWKARYLHPDYYTALNANTTIEQVFYYFI